MLKKSRILIAILDFLSTLKRTMISAFVSLLFINGITCVPFKSSDTAPFDLVLKGLVDLKKKEIKILS